MFIKYTSAVLIVFCVVFANLGSGVSGRDDAAVKSDNEIIAGSVFHQAGKCTNDLDCHYEGKCETSEGGEKSCKCPEGTSGDFCGTVDECTKDPEKCGNSDDVTCTYDVLGKKAVCKCNNDSKTYVPGVKKCATPCKWSSECVGRWSLCDLEVAHQKFCQCMEGSIGENCEIVDQCRDKIVDCGVDNNATCLLGDKGKAYCKCNDYYQGFEDQTKTCKDCDCGEKSFVDGCEFEGGKKKCDCDMDFYQSEEGKCVDCNCGDGSVGCKYANGIKTCHCFNGFAPKGGVCVDCKCGPNAKCKIEDDKTVCTCIKGYLSSGPNGHCLLICNGTNPCENGGTCTEGVCSCLNGTSGDLCRTIEKCHGFRKCGQADCLFNVYSMEAYCKCSDPSLTFEDYWKRCQVCDCGSNAISCTFKYTMQKCTCKESYQDLNGKCKLCSCKGPTDDPCRFDRSGKEVCNCTKGYIQVGNVCKKCNCGDNGGCELDDFSGKICNCNEEYSSDGDKCIVCDCGKNGTCGIYGIGERRCRCYEGNKEFIGKCLECDCGGNADCNFNGVGEKECFCHPEYAMKSGICTACNCGEGSNCTFDESSNTTKQCICHEGLTDDRGTCRECDCGLVGSNCSYAKGLTKCRCPEGYSEARNTTSQSNAFCKDVDECLQSGVCPSSTNCVNTIGSYDCVCKDGYTPLPKGLSYYAKVDGCQGTSDLLTTAGIVIGCVVGGMILLGAGIEFRKKRTRSRV